MCLLKEENIALREQIEAIQRAIDLQKSEYSLKGDRDRSEIQKLQLNVVIMTATNEQQGKRLHELLQNAKPVTSLEEAVQRCLKPIEAEQSPPLQQKNTIANGSIAAKSSVKKNKSAAKKTENAFACQDVRLKIPSLKINRITENSVSLSKALKENRTIGASQNYSKISNKNLDREFEEDWEREFELEDWDKEIDVFGPHKILLD